MEGDNSTRAVARRRWISSRWRPTREQICMLKNLYMQGVRRPSDEQIQQIINRLKTCAGSDANIKATSIFYWFQNHKARLKKQDRRHVDEALALVHANAHANIINSSTCNANVTATATPVTLTLFPLEPNGNLRNANYEKASCSRPIKDLD